MSCLFRWSIYSILSRIKPYIFRGDKSSTEGGSTSSHADTDKTNCLVRVGVGAWDSRKLPLACTGAEPWQKRILVHFIILCCLNLTRWQYYNMMPICYLVVYQPILDGPNALWPTQLNFVWAMADPAGPPCCALNAVITVPAVLRYHHHHYHVKVRHKHTYVPLRCHLLVRQTDIGCWVMYTLRHIITSYG